MGNPNCTKCLKEILPGQGMRIITIGSEEDNVFCKSCLKQAMHILQMKKHKKKDEILLLTKIRLFFNHVKN